MSSNMRVLTFSYGNAHGPNGIFGSNELQITTQDNKTTVTLTHQQLDKQSVWTAVLEADTEQAIWEAFKKSDFPNTARPEVVVPDTTMCNISALNPTLFSGQVEVSLPLDVLEKLPGYTQLLPMLHSIIFQMSGGSIGKNTLPETVVSNISG